MAGAAMKRNACVPENCRRRLLCTHFAGVRALYCVASRDYYIYIVSTSHSTRLGGVEREREREQDFMTVYSRSKLAETCAPRHSKL